jgi:hypothetical protein
VQRRIACWKHAVIVSALCAVPLAASADITTICDASQPFALSDDLNGFTSPCAIAPGGFAIDAVYLQNASSVGGTALAAFPMVRLRTGALRRVQLVVDAPAQIAESKPGGGGLWPITHAGYGIDYTFMESRRAVIALQTEVLPPSTPWAPSQSQPKYQLGLTSNYQVTPRLQVGVSASGTSSGSVGFERVLPGLAVRTAFAVAPDTQIAGGLGTRIAGRREVAQSVGNLSVNQRLRKNVLLGLGLGTSFNAVANAKVHYLASGMSYRF